MSQICKQFPGKTAVEIYEKVDQLMQQLTAKLGLKYDKDPAAKTGKVSKLGATGQFLAKEGEVVIDLSFSMLVPGALKKQIQDEIERKLGGLFA